MTLMLGKALADTVERLGLTIWVRGEPYGRVKPGNLVGNPMCSNCEKPFELGVTMRSGGHICRDCLDGLRRAVFDLFHDKMPHLFRRGSSSK